MICTFVCANIRVVFALFKQKNSKISIFLHSKHKKNISVFSQGTWTELHCLVFVNSFQSSLYNSNICSNRNTQLESFMPTYVYNTRKCLF